VLTGGVLTSPKNLKFEKKSHDHEHIFIEHHDWLLDWARQITRGTREEAEDLVQDLYVRFVQMKTTPDLPDEEHIRSYLYKALKNMFISRKLRHGRDAVSGLSVVEFDSVEFAMASVDRSKLLYVRSDLAAICEYVILRRGSSKAAVAFALRFFFGYLPTEAAALLRTNRDRV
jgi:DNA-directed RNA polymerase specialized sigma24 family protein